ncbi:MAG: UvrD-helicase domain-containing protein [Fusobacteriaceae bacterium]
MKKILKASAGTGKTYRLSIEYIVSLLKGESYKDILVMTFTKKATGEIIERIVDFLRLLSADSEDGKILKEKDELKKSILNLYPEIIFSDDKIKEISKEINSQIDNLRIYTIDSFIGKIFKSAIAPHLGIENYIIIDEDEEEKINIRLLEKILENKKSFEIFKDFLANNFEKKVDNYGEVLKGLIDTRWKYLLLKESGIPLEKRIDTETKREITEIIDEILSVIENIRDIKDKERSVESYTAGHLKKYLQMSCEEKSNFVKENWELLLEKNSWDGRSIKSNTKDIGDEFGKLVELTDILKEEVSISTYNNEVIQYEKSVLEFIDELYKNYDEIKLREGKLSFQDITTYTFKYYKDEKLNLFSNGEITEYFKELFDSKIKTVFIDEFQDTSVLQWKLLKGIVAKAQTAFCVGDEKQSLYGWRGGEKELFEKLSSILKAEEESLDTSYRSKESIVNFTNELFLNCAKLYEENFPFQDLTWDFSPVKSFKKDMAYIKIIEAENNEGSEDELYESSEKIKGYEKIIAETLLQKFNGVYKNVAIIGRKTKELAEIATVLSNYNIPYTLKSRTNIFNHRVNDSVFKLLKYIVYSDFLSLLEFLRSDLIMIDSSLLKEVLKNKEKITESLDSDLDEIITGDLLLDNVFSRIKSLKKKYRSFRGKVESFIVEIFMSFPVFEKYNGDTDIKNYYRFLEIAKNYDSIGELIFLADNNPSNQEFAQVSIEENNAVTLTTIHGSKGLEYDTVFYIHNPSDRGKKADKLNFLLDLDENFEYAKNFVIYSSKHSKLISNFSTYTAKNEFDFIDRSGYKKIQEEINTWYVAITRVKSNMFLILVDDKTTTKKDKAVDVKGVNILHYALKKMENEMGVFSRESIEEGMLKAEVFQSEKEDFLESGLGLELENSSKLEDKSEFKLNLNPLEIDEETLLENSKKIEEAFYEFSILNEESRKIGTALHYYLENISSLEKRDIEVAKNKTLSQYGSILGYGRLKSILNSPKLKKSIDGQKEIFSDKWDMIYNEYEVRSQNGELKRIDRLMIKKPTLQEKGEIFIVDYKTGEKDVQQIEEYEEIIKIMLQEQGIEEKYNIKSEFVILKY